MRFFVALLGLAITSISFTEAGTIKDAILSFTGGTDIDFTNPKVLDLYDKAQNGDYDVPAALYGIDTEELKEKLKGLKDGTVTRSSFVEEFGEELKKIANVADTLEWLL